jgi:arylformamidase
MLMSGMLDLYPVVLSSRSSYLKITTDEQAAFSPMRHLDRIACPIAIVSADQDSREFKRQSAVFAGALAGMGRLASRTELFNTNHFQEVEAIRARGQHGQPGSVLPDAALTGQKRGEHRLVF